MSQPGKFTVTDTDYIQIEGQLTEVRNRLRLGLRLKGERSPLNPSHVKQDLQDVLEGAYYDRSFGRIFKTLLIGGKTFKEIRELMKQKEAELTSELRNFSNKTVERKPFLVVESGMLWLGEASCLEQEEKIDLVIIQPWILFPDKPRFRDFIEAIKNHPFYDTCPTEVGPCLRLNYLDQPADTVLFIAIEPDKSTQEVYKYSGIFELRSRESGGGPYDTLPVRRDITLEDARHFKDDYEVPLKSRWVVRVRKVTK